MDSNFSYLQADVEHIRTMLDASRIDGGKYTDSYICSYSLTHSMRNVLSRLSNNSGCRILQKFRITPVAGQTRYKLPPCIEGVIRLQFTDTLGNVVGEIQPFSPWSANGQGWRLEGTPGFLSIVFDATPDPSQFLDIVYISNGDWYPHYGEGDLEAPKTGNLQVMSLATAPILGTVDRRESAYLGSHVRIIPSSNAPVQERQILRHWHDGTDWKIEFEATNPELIDKHNYEIVVPGFGALHHAVAMLTAFELSVALSATQSKQGGILTLYKTAMKTALDNVTSINRALGFYMERNVPGSAVNMTFGKN
ncbi:MAG: hypothetical protein ACK5U7_11825 [Bacteroidota bacterium]|jgi:hypothetical protein